MGKDESVQCFDVKMRIKTRHLKILLPAVLYIELNLRNHNLRNACLYEAPSGVALCLLVNFSDRL